MRTPIRWEMILRAVKHFYNARVWNCEEGGQEGGAIHSMRKGKRSQKNRIFVIASEAKQSNIAHFWDCFGLKGLAMTTKRHFFREPLREKLFDR